MICRYVEWRLANQASAGLGVLQHLQRCQTCQSFHASLTELEFSLRGAAALAPRPAASKARRRARLVLPTLVFSSAVVVIALVWSQLGSQDSYKANETTEQATQPMAIEDLGHPLDANMAAPMADRQESATAPSMRALALAFDVAPLETELDAWRHDGQRGLDAILELGRRSSVER